MSEAQQINVNVNSSAGEILRIVSTVLLFGGAGATAWAFAQGQHKEVATTFMTLMIVMMVKLMYARGMVALPAGSGGEGFATTKSTLNQIAAEYRTWLAGTSMPALAAISIAYAIAFLVLRAATSAAFGVFQNVYVAGGCAAMVGAVVVFPSLVPSMLAGLRRKGVVTTPAPAEAVQQAPVAPVAPQPAPVQAPAAQPAPKVVRRVVRRTEADSTTEKKEA